MGDPKKQFMKGQISLESCGMRPAVVVPASHHWCKACLPWVMQIKCQSLRLSVDIRYFRNSDATRALNNFQQVLCCLKAAVCCCGVWLSLSFEEKLSKSLCNLLGSWAGSSEELRPEILVCLIDSEKHRGGWMEGNDQNICAQSKLTH